MVVKEEPDFSEDEPQPQADPPAAASWVFVRDLLDESAVNPEAPTSPAQAPEEAAAATAASSTGAGGPAQAGGTAQAESPADSGLLLLRPPGAFRKAAAMAPRRRVRRHRR